MQPLSARTRLLQSFRTSEIRTGGMPAGTTVGRVRIAAVALLVLLVAAGCGSSDEQTAPPPQPTTTTTEPPASASTREAAPPLSGESLDGEALALDDFRGRPVMINVWSSW